MWAVTHEELQIYRNGFNGRFKRAVSKWCGLPSAVFGVCTNGFKGTFHSGISAMRLSERGSHMMRAVSTLGILGIVASREYFRVRCPADVGRHPS
eukprot:2559815-Amphidinium_carterae.1